MLPITVRTESGPRRLRPTDDELAAAVRAMGSDPQRHVVLARIPDLPEEFAQSCPVEGGWTVEHRAGGPDRHYETLVTDLGRVAELLTGWARGEAGWDAGVDWQPMDFGPAPEPAPLTLGPEDETVLLDAVRLLLAGGYATRADAAELAEEYLVDGDRRPVSRAQAAQLADQLWLERVAEQRSWQGETDPERLTRAFAALDARGITAREDFTCCRSCGHGEIWADGEPDARGFVYFHRQCTESAARGEDLMLLYGGFDDSEATTTAVGHEVAEALRDIGLTVRWDGDPGHAIRVVDLDWRRRLIG
ncbi:hypothetical protein AB0K51_05855 [Kitasatospora sp. NPDC049285]|uniref:DUF6891 domain-containing protein n=1 Tax=Kitasatospora sp. NPDC049285 TaxID=3157096 RepID=UPI003429A657